MQWSVTKRPTINPFKAKSSTETISCGLLGCYTVQWCGMIPTFRRAKLHNGVITQKTTTCVFTAVKISNLAFTHWLGHQYCEMLHISIPTTVAEMPRGSARRHSSKYKPNYKAVQLHARSTATDVPWCIPNTAHCIFKTLLSNRHVGTSINTSQHFLDAAKNNLWSGRNC
jgi:hypothetical protein